MGKIKKIKNKLSKEKNYIFLFIFIILATSIFYSLANGGQLMRDTAESYLSKFKIEDLKLVSSHGIGDEELKIIEETLDASTINVGYQMDVGIESTPSLVNIESMPESWVKFDLKEGRMPEESGEIAIDENLTDFPYKIGDTIKLTRKGDNPTMRLKRYEYTIVGRISSPEYILKSEKGISSFTGSSLDGYGLIMPEDFDIEKPNFARISLDSTKNLSYFSDKYKAIVDNEAYLLGQAFKDMPEKKLDIVKNEAIARIDKSKLEIENLSEKRKTSKKDQEEADKNIKSLRDSYNKNKEEFDARLEKSKDFAENGPEKKTKLDEEVKNLTTNRDKLKGQYDVQSSDVDSIYSEYGPIKDEYESLAASIADMQATIDSEYPYVNTRLDEVTSEISYIRSTLEGASIGALIEATHKLSSLQNERNDLEARQAELIQMQSTLDSDQGRLASLEYDYNRLKSDYDSAKAVLDDYEESLNDVNAQLEEKSKEKEDLDKNIAEAKTFLDKEKEPMESALKKEKSNLDKEEESYKENSEKYENFMVDSEKEIENLKAVIKRSEEERDGKVIPTYSVDLSSDNSGMGLYSSITYRVDMMTRTYPLVLIILSAFLCLLIYYRIFKEAGIKSNGNGLKDLKEAGHSLSKPLILSLIALAFGLALSYLLSFAIFKLYGDSFIFSKPSFEIFLTSGLIVLGAFALAYILALLMAMYMPEKLDLDIKDPSRNNLFSRPLRLVSGILSMAACIGLLFLGLSLSRSIRNISNIQYNDIVGYQVELEILDNVSEKDMGDLEFFITDIKGARDMRDFAVYDSQTVIEGHPSMGFELRVPKTLDNFDRQMKLRNKKGHKIDIPEEGIIISKKMAELNGLKPGDKLDFKIGDSGKYEASIVDVFENYISDFAYLSPAYYKKVTGSDPVYRQKNIVLVDSSDYAIEKFVKELGSYDYIQSINTELDAVKSANNIIKPLNFISILYIVIGAIMTLLVFLYQAVFVTDYRLEEIGGNKGDIVSKLLGQHSLSLLLASLIGLGLGVGLFNKTTIYVVRDNISIIPDIYWLDFAIVGIFLIVLLAFVYTYESSKYPHEE